MNFLPSYAVDFNDKSGSYSSKGEKDSLLKFDFIERKIHPSYFSIRTWNNSKGHSHLQNWVIEGSNTNKENDWVILDSRNNNVLLDDYNDENTFRINNTNLNSGEFYRYLRIRQTGPNSHGTNQIVINAIEFSMKAFKHDFFFQSKYECSIN